MDPDTVADIIAAIHQHWATANDLEITLEANPGSIEAGRFAAYHQAGVNRISMGIQALNDADLKRLGRIHTADEALRAFDVARNEFERVSFDLIYGRQDQTVSDWRSELKQALSLSLDHVSLYQLTVENGTAFGDRYARGKLRGLPDDDLSADLYTATQELCETFGMPAYEVSNHAVDGAHSRHNLIYWRYGDYIGIGPGAHGRLTQGGQKWATECYSNPTRWLDGAKAGQTEKPRTALNAKDQAAEFLLMGLRLRDGIDCKRYQQLSGVPLDTATLEHLQNIGMIELNGPKLIVKDQGVMVLNSIIEALLPD